MAWLIDESTRIGSSAHEPVMSRSAVKSNFRLQLLILCPKNNCKNHFFYFSTMVKPLILMKLSVIIGKVLTDSIQTFDKKVFQENGSFLGIINAKKFKKIFGVYPVQSFKKWS